MITTRCMYPDLTTCDCLHRFGYVEFSSMRKAKDALDNLNGLELDGREVRLDFAKGPRGGGGGGGASGDDRRGGARGGGGGGRGKS